MPLTCWCATLNGQEEVPTQRMLTKLEILRVLDALLYGGLVSRPRHVRHGPMMRMRARHPTRNRVYTLASPPSGASPKVSEKNKQTPGDLGRLRAKVQKPAETTFWARPAHAGGCLPTGPSLAGRLEGAGGALGPGAASPEVPRSALSG